MWSLVVVGVVVLCVVVCGGSNGVPVGAWVPMGFQLIQLFYMVLVVLVVVLVHGGFILLLLLLQ